MTRPLLLIDVDGPLNPYASSGNQIRKDKRYHRYRLLGFVVWLNRWHGAELKKLPYDLVWCTTWGHDANNLIGPRIGLPKLPVIEFPECLNDHDARVYFKTPTVIEYAAGRPFAWIDDEISKWDYEYIKKHHDGPSNVMYVDPCTGLTEHHFAALTEWADTLTLVEET